MNLQENISRIKEVMGIQNSNQTISEEGVNPYIYDEIKL